jgi:hypothetical protein
MDTLAKLATDNGFLLYPTKVPIEYIDQIPYPCIMYTNHHFEYVEEPLSIPPICVERDVIFLLTHELLDPTWILSEVEAKDVKGADVGQMLTPPKSKSPWEAMTAGSTGGWAKGIEGWGPVITAASGAIPVVGPFISTGLGAAGAAGKGTGFQGTDYGWNNVLPTIGGAVGGYGLGGLGAGVAGGISNAAGWAPQGVSSWTQGQTGPNVLGNFAKGFGTGVKNYTAPLGNFLKGVGGKLGQGLNNAAGGLGNMFTGGGAAGAGNVGTASTAGGGFGNILSNVGSMFGGGQQGAAGAGVNLAGNGIFSLGDGLSLLGSLTQNSLTMEMSKNPEFVEPPELQMYRDAIGKAKTELGQMSRDQIGQAISQPIGSIIPENEWMNSIAPLRTKILDQAEEKKNMITSRYNSIGRANSSEHMQELAKIDKEASQAVTDYYAQLMGQKLTMELDYKLSALSAGLGVDMQAASELAGLTNLTVQEAALKYGIESAMVQQLRQQSGIQQIYQMLIQAQMAMYEKYKRQV